MLQIVSVTTKDGEVVDGVMCRGCFRVDEGTDGAFYDESSGECWVCHDFGPPTPRATLGKVRRV